MVRSNEHDRSRAISSVDISTKPHDATAEPKKAPLVFRPVANTYFVAAVAVGFGAWYYMALRRNFFFVDDYWYLFEAKESSLSLDYLAVRNFDHFAPIIRLIYKVYFGTFGIHWRPAPVLLTILVLACAYAVRGLSRALGATRGWSTVAFVLFLLSPAVFHTAQWWGAAIHVFVGFLCTFWSVTFFARWQKTGASRLRWFSLALLLLGLLTQERPATVVIAVLLLSYFRPSENWSRQPLRSVAASSWPHLLVAGGYALFYFASSKPQTAGFPAPTEIGRLLLSMIVNSASLAVGWSPLWLGWLIYPVAVGVFGVSLLLLILYRVRIAWGAVVTLITLVGVNMSMLAYGRLSVLPADVLSNELQYYVDILAWVFILVPLCIRKPEYRSREMSTVSSSGRGKRVNAAALTLVIALIIGCLTMPRSWASDVYVPYNQSSKAYANNIANGMETLHELGDAFEILPILGSAGIIPSWAPLRQPEIASLFDPDMRPLPGARRKFVFDDSGQLREVLPIYLQSAGSTDQQDQPLAYSGTPAATRSDLTCGSAEGEGGVFSFELDQSTVVPTGTIVEVNYSALDPFDLQVATVDQSGLFNTTLPIRAPSGSWTIELPFDPIEGAVRVVLSGPADKSTVCMRASIAELTAWSTSQPGVCEAILNSSTTTAASSTGCQGRWR